MMAKSLLPAIAGGILSTQRVCDEYLHLCPKPDIKELDIEAYVFKVLSEKPDIIKDNNFVDEIYEKIANDKSQRKTIKSIQLSDLHIDFKYQEGTPTKCNFPICCRDNGPEDFTFADSPLAQKWGDYNCDSPHITLQSMFDFIGQNQDEL